MLRKSVIGSKARNLIKVKWTQEIRINTSNFDLQSDPNKKHMVLMKKKAEDHNDL